MSTSEEAWRASKTPRRDIAAAALKHYEELSDKACHWMSVIPMALRLWEAQEDKDTALRALIAEMREPVRESGRECTAVSMSLVRDWADRLAALLPKE